jgi:thymidylate synthase
MINKELKRLSRRELVDIIYQLKKNEQEMQEEMETLKNELQDKRIRISTAGSIADAALSVTNMFSTAQMTADLYLHEILCMREDTEKECAKRVEEAEKKVREMLADCDKKVGDLKVAYEKDWAKWQQLKTEIDALEEKKKSESCEGEENV